MLLQSHAQHCLASIVESEEEDFGVLVQKACRMRDTPAIPPVSACACTRPPRAEAAFRHFACVRQGPAGTVCGGRGGTSGGRRGGDIGIRGERGSEASCRDEDERERLLGDSPASER